MKTNSIKRKTDLKDSLVELKGNLSFQSFMKELDTITGYGKTIFDKDLAQNAYNQGKQSISNLIHMKLEEIEKEKKGK